MSKKTILILGGSGAIGSSIAKSLDNGYEPFLISRSLQDLKKLSTGLQMTVPTEPLVSILMNCFNGEKFLREAIESVQAQTYQNWEVIFWDNQSNDSSASVTASWALHRWQWPCSHNIQVAGP